MGARDVREDRRVAGGGGGLLFFGEYIELSFRNSLFVVVFVYLVQFGNNRYGRAVVKLVRVMGGG